MMTRSSESTTHDLDPIERILAAVVAAFGLWVPVPVPARSEENPADRVAE